MLDFDMKPDGEVEERRESKVDFPVDGSPATKMIIEEILESQQTSSDCVEGGRERGDCGRSD